MSKNRYNSPRFLKLRLYRCIPLLSFLFLFHLLPGYKYPYAQNLSSNNYQLTYEKNLLSISAKKASLKSILIDIAEKCNISIRYPSPLDEKITIKITNTSLKNALKRLLKDFNYSVTYSRLKKRDVISDVYILEKDSRPRRVTGNDSRADSRIRSYENRIETLKKNLAKTDANSARGKRYLRQIQSYEKTIERLKTQ